MARFFTTLSLAAGLLLSGLFATPSLAGLAEPLLQLKSFPQCHETQVLGQIVKRFNGAEEKTWHRGVYMSDINHVRPRLERSRGHDLVPRRYCRATATLSSGRHRTVFYLIEGGAGFAGTGYNLEFCVEGLDPWRVHDGSCRALRY